MMTIIVLWILLGIIAFIVILLHFSIIAEIRADKNGVDIKAKYMFFTVYPRPPKKPKRKKNKKSPKAEKTKSDLFEDNLDEELSSLDEDDKLKAESVQTEPEKTDELVITDHTTAKEDKPSAEKQQPVEDKTKEETVSEKISEKPEEPQKIKTKKKPEKEKKPKKDKTDKSPSKLDKLKAQYKKYKPYFPAGWKCVKKLLKAIRFTNIDAKVTIGREDAYNAAMAYGKLQAALFSAVGWLANIFTVKAKKIDVDCVFDKKVLNGQIYLKVKVRPSTIISIAFCTLVNFLIVFFRQRNKRKKKIKAMQKRKEAAANKAAADTRKKITETI